MTATLTPIETPGSAVVLHFGHILKNLTDDEFMEFCLLNEDLRIELTSEGDLIIMPPTGGESGRRNSILNCQIVAWTLADATGQPFDSSTIFTLPNRAKRSPDFAWVRNERWNALTKKEREGFPPLCPDFVVELRSPSDPLEILKNKMKEYIDNGAQLGWLLDPFEKRVHIYRPGDPDEVLDDPQTVSGEPLLHGLILDVQAVW